MWPRAVAAGVLALLSARVSAQILTSGNSQLPACAQSCTVLTQAETACGGQTTADLSTWGCFCQSAWRDISATSADTICAASCTESSDRQDVMQWYTSNCGADNGASEHAAGAAATASSTTAAASAPTSSASSSSSGTASPGDVAPGSNDPSRSTNWWSGHYQWVIMLIALLVGLLLLALLAVLLKRRHDRRMDVVSTGFNEGITTRTTGSAHALASADPFPAHGSGRDSPARTREAFMPYGYGYTRSESRLASTSNLGATGAGSSPLAHDGTTVNDLEKSGVDAGTPSGPKKKRVFVRERSMDGPDSPDEEKREVHGRR